MTINRRLVVAGAALAGVAPVAKAQTDEGAAVAERFAATLSAHDLAGFAALYADGYVNNQLSAAAPPPPGKTPKEASVAFFAARLAGMPDLQVSIEQMVTASGIVAASFVYSGTHGGTFFGIPPTGRALRFTSCDIFSVRNGQLVEHWGMGDIAGVLAQLRA